MDSENLCSSRTPTFWTQLCQESNFPAGLSALRLDLNLQLLTESNTILLILSHMF